MEVPTENYSGVEETISWGRITSIDRFNPFFPLLALTVSDLDFERKTIRVNKSADDRTRVVRQPKTKKSVAMLPMPSSLEALLRNYLKHHWKENPGKLLFPTPRKEGFAYSRNNVVRSGLKPILRKLGIPDENVGLHAFRQGLATELAESEPITVLQAQMRHVSQSVVEATARQSYRKLLDKRRHLCFRFRPRPREQHAVYGRRKRPARARKSTVDQSSC